MATSTKLVNCDDFEHWKDDQYFLEAVEDSKTLQTLTNNLLYGIQSTQYELQQQSQTKDELSLLEKFHLRHVEE